MLRSLMSGVAGVIAPNEAQYRSVESPLVALVTLGLLLAVLTTAFILPAGRAALIQPMEAIQEE